MRYLCRLHLLDALGTRWQELTLVGLHKTCGQVSASDTCATKVDTCVVVSNGILVISSLGLSVRLSSNMRMCCWVSLRLCVTQYQLRHNLGQHHEIAVHNRQIHQDKRPKRVSPTNKRHILNLRELESRRCSWRVPPEWKIWGQINILSVAKKSHPDHTLQRIEWS